jgi:hypothetical protein
MRLDEPEQVDMVLGDGARDRGATADLISSESAIGAGIAYVRHETHPDPVRVRAAWVTDDDIAAKCARYVPVPQSVRSIAASPLVQPHEHDNHCVADRRPVSGLRNGPDLHGQR